MQISTKTDRIEGLAQELAQSHHEAQLAADSVLTDILTATKTAQKCGQLVQEAQKLIGKDTHLWLTQRMGEEFAEKWAPRYKKLAQLEIDFNQPRNLRQAMLNLELIPTSPHLPVEEAEKADNAWRTFIKWVNAWGRVKRGLDLENAKTKADVGLQLRELNRELTDLLKSP